MHGHASRWRTVGWGAVAAILLLPALGMLMTDEVAWGLEDFVAAALLLGTTGLGLETTMRLVQGRATRVAIGLGLLATLLLIWAELAVGLVS